MSKGRKGPKSKRERRRSEQKHGKKTAMDGSSKHESQRNPDRSTIEEGRSLARHLVIPILSLVSLVLVIKLFVNTPIGERFVAVTAGLAVIYDVFDWVNWKRVLLLREKRLWRLLGVYVLSFLVMVAVAVVGFIVSPGSWQGLLVVVAFLLVAFGRAHVEDDICDHDELGMGLAEPIWGKKFAAWVDMQIGMYADRTVDNTTPFLDVAKREFARLIRKLPISPHHDGRRAVAVFVIAAALLFGGWVGVVWAKRNAREVAHDVKVALEVISPFGSSGKKKPDTSGIAAKSAAEAARSAGNAAPVAPEVVTSPGLMNECPTPLVTGGPRWIREDLTALYLGGAEGAAAEAPGTSIAGCPGELHLMHTSAGLFAYTLGRSSASNQTLSIAVDSSYGRGLFLAPAVTPVLYLVHELGAVGGMRRFSVAGGDFYPVVTRQGTYILIRREIGTEQVAEPYLVMPPVVAQAWALAMAKSQMFLWPVPRRENGETIYDFDSNSTPSRVVYTFPYRPSNTIEPELSEGELEADAKLAG